MDLAGIYRPSVVCAVGPANAVADVAHRGCTPKTVWPDSQDSGPGAARRHHRHVAGVEIGPEGRNDPRCVGQPAGGGFVVQLGST